MCNKVIHLTDNNNRLAFYMTPTGLSATEREHFLGGPARANECGPEALEKLRE